MNILNKEKILEQARGFINEGKFDKAIREYEKILLADPGDLRVKLRVAELYTKRKQITEAIRIYREVADAYANEGFYLKAVTVHKNILRLNPSLIEINELLADLYEKMGLTADAIRQYDILASALDLKGATDRVLEVRARIVKLGPKDGAARIRLAELYQRSGKTDEAIDQYEEYAKQLEASEADPSKLADVFEKILVHRPDRQDLLRKIISIYNKIGDFKKALKWLEAGKEVTEKDPELLRLAAKIYSSQNQNETTRTKYMKLADLHIEAGDIKAALDVYCDILVLLPDEEDRLARRIEELKPGALPKILARAQKQRAVLEQEEIKKQDTEEAKVSSAPKIAPPVAQPIAPVQKPKTATSRKNADAAFELGTYYRQIGLGEESESEFEKAKLGYNKCLEAGIKDPEIENRLEQIKSSNPKEKKADDTPKTSPVNKKKKVSFV